MLNQRTADEMDCLPLTQRVRAHLSYLRAVPKGFYERAQGLEPARESVTQHQGWERNYDAHE